MLRRWPVPLAAMLLDRLPARRAAALLAAIPPDEASELARHVATARP